MEDKYINPFADLTRREHALLRVIAHELILPESPQQAPRSDNSVESVDGKIESSPSGSIGTQSKKD
jgi:hypothetical protein